MHFEVDGIPEFKSLALPKSVERALRPLFQSDSIVTLEALSNLSPLLSNNSDSNLDVVAEALGHDIVADGSIAVQVVIAGLKRRLAAATNSSETIRLVGE
jgi:hypothetical protein